MNTDTTVTTDTMTELETTLAQFTGTEGYHTFSTLSNLVITDGVKYLADKTNCYWFLDIIASYQRKCNKDPMLKEFQIWTLTTKNGKGKVICERDKDDPKPITQKIKYTDFSLQTIKLYCMNNVILLPSEY
jgi:hypothetical protein